MLGSGASSGNLPDLESAKSS